MKQDVKEKWVAALRSNKYKQGRSRLRNSDDTYCCLGVLCDVVDNSKWNLSANGEWYSYSDDNDGDDGWIYSVSKDLLPDDNMQGDLMGMNDHGKSFTEIADYIEQNL